MSEVGVGVIVVIVWVLVCLFWSHRKDSPTRQHLYCIETKLAIQTKQLQAIVDLLKEGRAL